MKASLISTVNLWNAPRSNLGKLQEGLAKATIELTTGRHADVGLALGSKISSSFSVRQEIDYINAIQEGNSSIKVRIDGASASLDSMRSIADNMSASIIALPAGSRNIANVVSEAKLQLNSFISNLNRPVNGQYVFGGINSSVKAVNEYSDNSNSRLAIVEAFESYFGFSTSDPQMSDITSDEINAFISGPFSSLFDDPEWSENWSNASSDGITSRISESDTVVSSVSANDHGFKDVIKGFTLLLELGIGNLNDDARNAVLSSATGSISRGSERLADMQAFLGTSKSNIINADARMDDKKLIYTTQLSGLESVDPIEAKTRVDQITTQMQTSFAVTAQIRSMNLINFL